MTATGRRVFGQAPQRYSSATLLAKSETTGLQPAERVLYALEVPCGLVLRTRSRRQPFLYRAKILVHDEDAARCLGTWQAPLLQYFPFAGPLVTD